MRVQLRELALVFTKRAFSVWLLIGGFLSSWVLAYLLTILAARYLSAPAYLPTQVRYAGVLLEIFGFILVALGIRETRKLFNQPSLIEKIAQWFKLVASTLRRQDQSISPVTGRLNLTLSTPRISASGTVRPQTLERRVEMLEQTIDSIRHDLKEHAKRQEADIKHLDHAIAEEREERMSADVDESLRTEQLAVGGLWNEVIGLIWVVAGTLGSNMADEIARIMGRFI
jgi:hypothetical protein